MSPRPTLGGSPSSEHARDLCCDYMVVTSVGVDLPQEACEIIEITGNHQSILSEPHVGSWPSV